MSKRSIADYGLLSDCHSAALVSRDGVVEWLCLPRFDQPSVFGRILDDDAGHWSIQPSDEFSVSRRYHDGSLVLETRFETGEGVVLLDDLLATGPNERGHELGAESPHTFVRRIRGVEGSVALTIEWAPRPEYGIVQPLLVPSGDGILARGGATVLHMSSSVPLEITESSAYAEVVVEKGDVHCFAQQYRASSDPRPNTWSKEKIENHVIETIKAWQSWSEMHQGYEGPWEDLVHQSGRVLQGLTYFPTGAMVASRQRRFRKSWEAAATGTTGSAGSVTPASLWTHSGSPPVPMKHRSSSTSWPPPQRVTSAVLTVSRSCSGFSASTT